MLALSRFVACSDTIQAFSSNSDACPAPTVSDCLALRRHLISKPLNSTEINVYHSRLTPLGSCGNCTLAIYWDRSIGEGWAVYNGNISSQLVNDLLAYGTSRDTSSGVFGPIYPLAPSTELPMYVALTASYPSSETWESGFRACDASASTNLTESDPTVPPPSTVTVPISNEDKRSFGDPPAVQPSCVPSQMRTKEQNTYDWVCTCANRQYEIRCSYGRNRPWWSESIRHDAIFNMYNKVKVAWLGNTLKDGDAVLSDDPSGALLYAGVDDPTSPPSAPNQDDQFCCSSLLSGICGPSHGNDLDSLAGECEPRYSREFLFAFNYAVDRNVESFESATKWYLFD